MRQAPRKLTVLASLDVAGYTRLIERDERGTLEELATIRMRILRPTLTAHNGTLIKTMGDGAIVEFPSVEDSVRWGMEFQSAMADRNATKGDSAMHAYQPHCDRIAVVHNLKSLAEVVDSLVL